MNQMQMSDRTVRETEAAEIVGAAVQTMRNNRHLGKGPPYLKLGKSVRYRVSDLIEYLEKHRIDPESAS